MLFLPFMKMIIDKTASKINNTPKYTKVFSPVAISFIEIAIHPMNPPKYFILQIYRFNKSGYLILAMIIEVKYKTVKTTIINPDIIIVLSSFNSMWLLYPQL